MKTQQPIPVEEMPYEQAFAELEQIIRQLDENPPSLDESLVLFERGQALTQRCAALLDAAELRVRQLTGRDLLPAEE